MNYKNTAQFIIERRKKDLDYARERFNDAIASSTELTDLQGKIKEFILLDAKGQNFDKKDYASCVKKRDAILKKMGITKETLTPAPHCSVCGDTAFVDGKFCACVKNNAINQANHIELTLHDFSESNFELYDADFAQRNTKVFSDIKAISEKYPLNKKRTIILSGATGTGKTFLSSCCAESFLSKGFSVCAISAFSFVNRVLKYHTTFNDEKLSYLTPLLDSDLLIIDDLGTESILKNVTMEYLYMVISERINSSRLTLFTTNLSPDGILSRYGSRIYSRLFDKSLGYVNILGGSDLRLRK